MAWGTLLGLVKISHLAMKGEHVIEKQSGSSKLKHEWDKTIIGLSKRLNDAGNGFRNTRCSSCIHIATTHLNPRLLLRYRISHAYQLRTLLPRPHIALGAYLEVRIHRYIGTVNCHVRGIASEPLLGRRRTRAVRRCSQPGSTEHASCPLNSVASSDRFDCVEHDSMAEPAVRLHCHHFYSLPAPPIRTWKARNPKMTHQYLIDN